MEFKREPRYYVLKIKDVVACLSINETYLLTRLASKISTYRAAKGKLPFNAVVVEQDWPEFEMVWAAIEARMTGKQQAASAPEVKGVITTELARRLLEGGEKSLHGVLISDYIPGAEPGQPQKAASVPANEFPHDEMDAIALHRFKVEQTDSNIWGWCVRAGDGTQELYKGRKSDCEAVARRLIGAFLDGAMLAHDMLAAAPEAPQQSVRQPTAAEVFAAFDAALEADKRETWTGAYKDSSAAGRQRSREAWARVADLRAKLAENSQTERANENT